MRQRGLAITWSWELVYVEVAPWAGAGPGPGAGAGGRRCARCRGVAAHSPSQPPLVAAARVCVFGLFGLCGLFGWP